MKLASLIIFSPLIVVLVGIFWPMLFGILVMRRLNDPILAFMGFIMTVIAQVSYLMFLIAILKELRGIL